MSNLAVHDTEQERPACKSPLFVSYMGNKGGATIIGAVVLAYPSAVTDITDLVNVVRSFPDVPEDAIIFTWQRMEDPD